MPPPNASPLEDFSPRMLAARVLSGMPHDASSAALTTTTTFRRRSGQRWSSSLGLPSEAGVGTGPPSGLTSSAVRFQPYTKVTPLLAPPLLVSQPSRIFTAFATRLRPRGTTPWPIVDVTAFGPDSQVPPPRAVTNQQIEQKKRAERQMAAAAEHRAKVAAAAASNATNSAAPTAAYPPPAPPPATQMMVMMHAPTFLSPPAAAPPPTLAPPQTVLIAPTHHVKSHVAPPPSTIVGMKSASAARAHDTAPTQPAAEVTLARSIPRPSQPSLREPQVSTQVVMQPSVSAAAMAPAAVNPWSSAWMARSASAGLPGSLPWSAAQPPVPPHLALIKPPIISLQPPKPRDGNPLKPAIKEELTACFLPSTPFF